MIIAGCRAKIKNIQGKEVVPVTTVSTLIVNTHLLLKHSCIFIKLCKALAVMDEKWRRFCFGLLDGSL